MLPVVNYLAVIVATLSSMVVGSIWYAPHAFGARWMKLAGIAPERLTGAVRAIGLTVGVSFVTAWVLANAIDVAWAFVGGSFLVTALGAAVALWAGFTAARFVTHDAFEGRPAGLTVLNVAHEFVTIVVMALILGAWPPAGA